MAEQTPTFVFEDNKVLAFHEGSLIASGTEYSNVEKSALEYLEALNTKQAKEARETSKKTATTIITPNGVEAEILGRVRGQWGDEEVTIRTANGGFATLHIHGETEDQWGWRDDRNTRTAGSTRIAALSSTLDTTYAHNRDGLEARMRELQDTAAEASHLIASGISDSDAEKLDEIVLAAKQERHEIAEVLAHLDSEDLEPYEAPKFAAIEQASMGRAATDSWLDRTVQEMIDETDGQDLTKLLSEGPALFVSDLEMGALANAGVTQDMAYSHVVSKTAGYVGDDVKDYHSRFLARVEVARREELAARKEEMKREVVAKVEAEIEAPDEALFM